MKKLFVLTLLVISTLISACAEASDTTESEKGTTPPAEATASETVQTEPQTQPPPLIPAEETIKVITYNIQTENGNSTPMRERLASMKKQLEEYDPDIIGLQEVTVNWLNYLNSGFADEYTILGVARDGEGSNSEASTVMFKTAKYTLVDSKTFWLSETPDVVSIGWDAMYRRVCTCVVLKSVETGSEFVVMNTHFDHKGTTARENSVKLIVEKAAEYNCPLILTGDFNIKETNKLYSQITAQSSVLEDTKYKAAESDTGATFRSSYESNPENPPIDFIFVQKDSFTVNKYHIIREKGNDIYPSDHFPVYAELVLASGASAEE